MRTTLEFVLVKMAYAKIPQHVPVLTDDNYPDWAERMEALLQILGLSRWITAEPVGDDSQNLSLTALSHVRMNISAKFVRLIKQHTTCVGAWAALRDEHVANLLPLACDMQSKFFSCVMSPGQSASDYISDLEELNESLARIGRPVDEGILIAHVLTNVSPELKAHTAHLGTTAHTLTITTLRAALRAIERTHLSNAPPTSAGFYQRKRVDVTSASPKLVSSYISTSTCVHTRSLIPVLV